MGGQMRQRSVWEVARGQHGVISREQLLGCGLTRHAIRHRVEKARLHRLLRGVYAVGRPEVSREGWWMAAVLACGPRALLSHENAAQLWRIRPLIDRPLEVSLPSPARRRPSGIRTYRRFDLRSEDLATQQGIPVTSPACTIIDLAPRLPERRLERAINDADKLGLVTPEQLRAAADGLRRPGAKLVRELLDRQTFTLSDSDLELLFIPIALRAGLPKPLTRQWANGFRVDFYWPSLGLVVETDGGAFHRTPAEQTRDRRRDQAHTAAGLTQVRFTHGQIMFEPDYVEQTLAAVAQRLAAAG